MAIERSAAGVTVARTFALLLPAIGFLSFAATGIDAETFGVVVAVMLAVMVAEPLPESELTLQTLPVQLPWVVVAVVSVPLVTLMVTATPVAPFVPLFATARVTVQVLCCTRPTIPVLPSPLFSAFE